MSRRRGSCAVAGGNLYVGTGYTVTVELQDGITRAAPEQGERTRPREPFQRACGAAPESLRRRRAHEPPSPCARTRGDPPCESDQHRAQASLYAASSST